MDVELDSVSIVFYQGQPILVWREAGATKWTSMWLEPRLYAAPSRRQSQLGSPLRESLRRGGAPTCKE